MTDPLKKAADMADEMRMLADAPDGGLREAAQAALSIFDWLERRSIYQDAEMATVHTSLRAALSTPVAEPATSQDGPVLDVPVEALRLARVVAEECPSDAVFVNDWAEAAVKVCRMLHTAAPSAVAAEDALAKTISYHRDDEGHEAIEAYAKIVASVDKKEALPRLANLVAHGAKATLGPGSVVLTRSDWKTMKIIPLAAPHPAPAVAEPNPLTLLGQYDQASANLAQAMQDGGNVHGAVARVVGLREQLEAALLGAAPAVAAEAGQGERERFEAWVRKDCGDLSTFGTGRNMHYSNSAVNNAWTGWQARAARAALATQPAPPSPGVDELLVWAVEAGVIRLSQVMNADLQDALVAFAKRCAAPTQPPAEGN
jgi:hypothetical protein